MIQMQTSLEVADNSGARRVEMIMPIGGSTGKIISDLSPSVICLYSYKQDKYLSFFEHEFDALKKLLAEPAHEFELQFRRFLGEEGSDGPGADRADGYDEQNKEVALHRKRPRKVM